jgi:hypothetical protein
MNTKKRYSRCLTRLRVLLVLYAAAAVSGCSSTIKLQYVNWNVEFNQGTSELDKAVAMDSIRRYVLNSLSQQKDSFLYLRQINVNYNNVPGQDRAPIGIAVRFDRTGTTVTNPPRPGGGGPGQGFFPPPFPTVPNVKTIEAISAPLK